MTTGPIVVRSIVRADAAAVARLAAAGVATVHEAQGGSGLLDAYLRPRQCGASLAGPAVTVSCRPGDNLMLHLAVECCRPGDVLVVAVTSANTDGMLGELLATSLRARGVAGAIVDAGVRDVAALRAMAFPVWSRAVSAAGTTKAAAGSVNVSVVCAGQAIEPGDIIVADDDGVVRVPAAEASAVADSAQARMSREDVIRRRLAQGELSVDIHHLREVAAGLGVIDAGDRTDATGPRFQ